MTEVEGIDVITPPRNKGGRPPKDVWGQKSVDKIELSTLFSELPTGFNIKVYRKEPDWAAGYLGQMYNDGNTPVSEEELKKRFGGQILVLQVIDENSKFRSQKTIRINDVPKVDYQEVNPAFATSGVLHRPTNNNGTSSHAAPGTPGYTGMQPTMMGMQMPQLPPGLPPQLQRQLMSHYLGFPIPNEEKQKKESPLEMMQQKMVMDMMQQSSQQQLAQQQAALEMQRDMVRMRKEFNRDNEATSPQEAMNNTISMIRELKTMQGEFGGDSDNAITKIAGEAIPAVEGLLSEIINLKKVGMQAEVAQARASQPEPRQLPERTPATQAPPAPPSEPDEQTLEELAAKLGKQYHSLPPEKQQKLIDIFIAQTPDAENQENEFENISDSGNNEEIPPSNDDMLDEEDREILANGNAGGESETVQNGEHAGTTENNNSPDR